MSDVLDRATKALKQAQSQGDTATRDASSHRRSAPNRAHADMAAHTRELILERAELGRRERRITRAILLPIAASFVMFASWATASGAVQRVWTHLTSETPAAQGPSSNAAPADSSTERSTASRSSPSTSSETPATDPVPSDEHDAGSASSDPVEAPAAAAVISTPASVPQQRSPAPRRPDAPPSPSVARAEREVAHSKATASAPAPAPAPATGSLAAPAPSDTLYAAAHRAHFEAHDWSRALAAWDEYLADSPSGRFAPEARYNRALCLIRLGRHDEAQAALRPFADAAAGSYRQADALRLIDALVDAGKR